MEFDKTQSSISRTAGSTSTTSLHYKSTDDEDDCNNAGIGTKAIIMEHTSKQVKDFVSKSKNRSGRVLSSTPIQNLVMVETLDDFKMYMDVYQDEIVVVRFFASWCKVSPYFTNWGKCMHLFFWLDCRIVVTSFYLFFFLTKKKLCSFISFPFFSLNKTFNPPIFL